MSTNRYKAYLADLPQDWTKVPIEKIGGVFAGGTPSRLVSDFWNGTIPWVTPGELTNLASKWLTKTREYITEAGLANSAATLLPPDSLLVTTRATIGSVAIAGIEVCTNQGFKNIVLDERCDPLFYYYLLQFIAYEMQRLASGSTFDEISRQDFVQIIVPRPCLAEQCRIAEILDTIDAQIQETEQLIAKLKQVKAGLLHDLLTRGIDEHGEVCDPIAHPEQFKESPMGMIPNKWEITTLGSAVLQGGGTIQTGPFGSQLHAYEYTKEGIPVIMPRDIQEDFISESQIAYIPPSKAQKLARHRVKLNDVIFARRGDLSRSVSISQKEVGWLCGTGCLLVKPPQREIYGPWLAYTYRHYYSQRQILARAVGSTMINLNTTLLSDLVIAKPDYEEQVTITAVFNAHSIRLITEESHLHKLRQIKQGLMHDLLTGKVRVTQLTAVDAQ